MPQTILLADIGGTNARFALFDPASGLWRELEVYKTADYPNLTEAALAYVSGLKQKQADLKITHAILDVATAVTEDHIVFANSPWSFYRAQLQRDLGVDKLHIINDFTAVAMAIPELTPKDYLQIGSGTAVSRQPIGVIGPGTGLGVGYLLPQSDGTWFANSGEGGHVTASPNTPREWAVIDWLLAHKYQSHVSAERLVSGKGIENMYQALCAIDQVPAQDWDASEISKRGLSGECKNCREAMEIFCAMLGSVAGNLALTLGAHGGIYIAGGIPTKILEFFKSSDFRARFEAKGRRRQYLQAIPTYVIMTDHIGLRGLAALAKQGF